MESIGKILPIELSTKIGKALDKYDLGIWAKVHKELPYDIRTQLTGLLRNGMYETLSTRE